MKSENTHQILEEKSTEEHMVKIQKHTLWFIVSFVSGLIALTLAYILMK